MKIKSPFFSIVIPTRNRADTLKYSIKTILQQDFDNYEIIICDNNSTAETRDVVKSFCDNRIIYINSNQDLSMTENWEFAISYAKGEYITIIADNDGFIDRSLAYLYNILKDKGFPPIIRWEKNGYYWPDLNENYKKRLVLKTSIKEKKLKSQEAIEGVLQGKISFHVLPMIYCSIIKSCLVEELKTKTRRVFNSPSPDVYSGYAFANLAKEYISINTPITINGTSKKSNGYNHFQKKSSHIADDFNSLMLKSKFRPHPKVPFVRTLFAPLFDSFLRAKEDLNIDSVSLDTKYIMEKLANTVLIYDSKELLEYKKMFLDIFCEDKEQLNYAKELIEGFSTWIPPEPKRKLGFYENVLYLDGEEFGIDNIYEASKFMSHFYNYKRVY